MEETINYLQRIKLEHEIKMLKREFYQQPTFLAIISASFIAAAIIYGTIYMSRSQEIENLAIAKRTLDNKVFAINNQKLKEHETSLKSSIVALEEKEKNLNDSINFKYKKKLLNLEKNLKNIKDFYIKDHAIGYANATVKSKRVKSKTALFVKKSKIKEFEKWLYGELKRGIDASTQRTLDKIDFELKIKDFQSD
jgi:hypothetical protein